jgi:AmiR/NasT family two-component response regulator
MLGVRLFVEEETMGALNLYAMATDAFDDADVAIASVFAAHAAVAMRSSRREANLERKSETRDLIGQAKGILMSQSHIAEDEAFDLLRRASQRMNIKVTEVARGVVSREAPAQPEP